MQLYSTWYLGRRWEWCLMPACHSLSNAICATMRRPNCWAMLHGDTSTIVRSQRAVEAFGRQARLTITVMKLGTAPNDLFWLAISSCCQSMLSGLLVALVLILGFLLSGLSVSLVLLIC